MAAFLLELLSEEIPARMQARAAADLERLVGDAFAALSPSGMRSFSGPRRLALAADLAAEVPASVSSERGPRVNAPEQAVAGFLRKHGASREALSEEGGFWTLNRSSPPVAADAVIAGALPGLLRRFPWPKAMRWGGTSTFTWVRPLRRILCLLDGAVVPFDLAAGEDDGHGLRSGAETEGHRFLAPGAVQVGGVQDWERVLAERRVIASAAERRRVVAEGVAALAVAHGLSVVEDAGLLDEVAGLVEWPVPLLGRIDPAFMDLPPEVMQVSMRVNQRYFALRDAEGRAAPWFAFAANVEAPDGGAAIVAGNERVLRARFSDARHFWDLDRKTKLIDRVPALDGIAFHADLGSQGARAHRIARLARVIAGHLGADEELAARAALLCKADLTTGMVGEFPELQGIMGGYYAANDQETSAVVHAVRDHYLPRGSDPDGAIPVTPIASAVALADKIDQIVAFFAIGQRPTGSGDPFALRRAALGVIRIIFENRLTLPLRQVIADATGHVAADIAPRADLAAVSGSALVDQVLAFIAERMRVQLKAQGLRGDVIAAVLGVDEDGDLLNLLRKMNLIATFLDTDNGANLLAAYKRASNILRIEERSDGPHDGPVDPAAMAEPEEAALYSALANIPSHAGDWSEEDMSRLAELRAPMDAFFSAVMVNAEEQAVRWNRLRLLAQSRSLMNRFADFSQIDA